MLAAITAAAPLVPLVLLGGSLIAAALCSDLARSNICQFNIGTELRLVFGQALREAPARKANRFDRIALLFETKGAVTAAARRAIASLSE